MSAETGLTRKTITALFCDLVGSTTLAERHDAEVLRPVLRAYFDEMSGAIQRHGGSVEKYIGDAVVGVFGLPVAHEDDALRAIRAAMEMLERLPRLSNGPPIALAARIGISTGEVLVGDREHVLLGDVMNTASRLQASAEEGSVVIGEPAYRLVRDAILAERLGDLVLKGKAEPVPAWRVIALTSDSARRRRASQLSLVGREREVALLEEIYGRVVADRASWVVTVLAEAGVGKTRLIDEFLARAGLADAKVFRGECLPYGEGITYRPLAQIVRQAAGIAPTDAVDKVQTRLRTFAASLAEPGVERGLAGIVGVDKRVTQQDIVWAFRRALEHLAVDDGIVVLIEDLHWADEALLDILESIAALTRQSPIMIVCEARPELLQERNRWPADNQRATRLDLPPLSDGETRQLIESAAAEFELNPDACRRVAAAAEGNPFYVQEFIRLLLDSGEDADAGRVPPTINALLNARLDALPASDLAVAERAAIVGRSFDMAAVLGLFPPHEGRPVLAALDSLTERNLIRADFGSSNELRFSFGHQLIRDAAYSRIPKAERAQLHEHFADWLDQHASDQYLEVNELVGYHLEQAYRYREALGTLDGPGRDLAKRAAGRLVVAGRRAHDRSAIAAAADILDRAVKLLEPGDPLRRAILPDLGRALDSSGRFDEARACFAEAIDLAQAADDERALAYARVNQCLVFEREASLEERRRVADESYPVFARAGDDRGLALVWRIRSAASWRAGRGVGDEAALSRALQHARAAGAHREEVLIADSLSSSLTLGPTPVEDGILRCRAILHDAPGDRGIEMAMSHALAHLHARLGEFEIARTLARRCREIAAEGGQRAQAAHLTEVGWDVETLAGNHAAAESIVGEGCDEFVAMGKPHPMLEAFRVLSQTALGSAVDVRSLEAADEHESGGTRALLDHAIAAAYLHAGNVESAERRARAAVDFFAATDLITMAADSTLLLGDILLTRGRHDGAREVFKRAEELYRRKGAIVGANAAARRLDMISA
jgi:class 3 adenylate cyclase/tetratricopeptide (TPR) repeat protein